MEDFNSNVSFVAALLLIVAIIFVSCGINNDKYNDGICQKCDGQYELVEKIYDRDYIEIYKCNNCGNVIHVVW